MKIVRLIFFALIFFVLNGCRYTFKTDFKSKLKKNGPIYSYLFTNWIKQKEINYLFYKNVDIEIDITFDRSPEDLLKKKIYTKDFELKIGTQNIQSFQIDSVSFSAKGAPDRYELFYFCQINDSPHKVQFALVKTSEDWKIQ